MDIATNEAENLLRENEALRRRLDEAEDLVEAIHTEPKAATRDSEHGGLPGDREEAEGYAEEIAVVNSGDIASEVGEDTVVWTSESTEPAPQAAPQAADPTQST